MELGITTFAETTPDPATGVVPSAGQRLREVVEEVELAEQVGLAVYGIGEHHRADFAASAPAVVLAAAAARTSRIHLTSAVTVLSSDDPVRVFQDFATLDLLSEGRAEIIGGRGSFTESFPLFGYDMADYDELFEEKLELLLAVRDNERVTWSGRHRAALRNQAVYPRPHQEKLPVWIGVGGNPESVVRAGLLGLPMALAIIGGQPDRFAPLADLHRRALAEVGLTAADAPTAVHAHGFVSDDVESATEIFYPPYAAVMTQLGRERGWGAMTRAQFAGRDLARGLTRLRRSGGGRREDRPDAPGPRYRALHAPHQRRHHAARRRAPLDRAARHEGRPAGRGRAHRGLTLGPVAAEDVWLPGR